MKHWIRTLAVSGVVTLIGLTTTSVMAQQRGGGQGGQGGPGGRGDFDPEQMRQRMAERMREQFEVKSDDEWKVIEPRIQKVLEARRDVGFGGMGMGMFGRRTRPQGDQAGAQPQGDRRGFRGFGGEPNPEAEALQQAIDDKASAETIKAKLAAYRTARKDKQAKLDQAREELKKVLSSRQEAVAVLNGYLE